MVDHAIFDIHFSEASDGQQRHRLLGNVRFTLNDVIVVDDVTLCLARENRFSLSFPIRRDARGVEHPIVRPVDDVARHSIESQVFAALHRDLEAGP